MVVLINFVRKPWYSGLYSGFFDEQWELKNNQFYPFNALFWIKVYISFLKRYVTPAF